MDTSSPFVSRQNEDHSVYMVWLLNFRPNSKSFICHSKQLKPTYVIKEYADFNHLSSQARFLSIRLRVNIGMGHLRIRLACCWPSIKLSCIYFVFRRQHYYCNSVWCDHIQSHCCPYLHVHPWNDSRSTGYFICFYMEVLLFWMQELLYSSRIIKHLNYSIRL